MDAAAPSASTDPPSTAATPTWTLTQRFGPFIGDGRADGPRRAEVTKERERTLSTARYSPGRGERRRWGQKSPLGGGKVEVGPSAGSVPTRFSVLCVLLGFIFQASASL